MIHKARADSNFVVIPNDLAQHRGISFELRGFLVYILSKPTHWKVSIKDVQNEGGIGRDKVYKLLNEGMKVGYIRRIQGKEKNLFKDVEYEVFPLTEIQDTEIQDTENTDYIKERGTEKKEFIKESTGNDFQIDKAENNLPADTTHEWDLDAFEIWWRAYPNQLQKQKAKKAYMAAIKKIDCATLLRGAEEYARQQIGVEQKYIKRPDNWLREECWDDYQPKPKAKYLWDGNVVEVTPDVASQFNMTKIKG